MDTFLDLYDRAIKALPLPYYINLGSFKLLKNANFFQFENTTSAQEDKLSGWKFHLSVVKEDVPRATEIVAGIFKKHGARVFKVTDPEKTDKFTDPARSKQQQGKTFTLYDTGESKWHDILLEIESAFIKDKIIHGLPVSGERNIPGSRYIYYRNDGNFAGGKYNPAKDILLLSPDQRYNPMGLNDPFINISIQKMSDPKPQTDKRHDELSLLEDLKKSFGDNILNVQAAMDSAGYPEYHVIVPRNFSRNELTYMGFNPSLLNRVSKGNHVSCIIVPFEELPMSMRRDAAVFNMLSQMNVPIYEARRVTVGSEVTGYEVEVPNTISRDEFWAIVINTKDIKRRRGSRGNLNLLEISASLIRPTIVAGRPQAPQQMRHKPPSFEVATV